MYFLAIETSCDDTSLAVFKNKKLLSHLTSSQVELHRATGGVVPEVASRAHQEVILPLLNTALDHARSELKDLDAIAVTSGPGLLGSLLVGVQMARTLSSVLSIPLYGINHLEGHIYANFVKTEPQFPLLALIVSGGHTQLVLMKGHGRYRLLGETVDDAAGEAFDKVAKLLGLGFPGGPAIEKAAFKGDKHKFDFPRGMIGSRNYDFSFSGLKTAVINEVKNMPRLSLRNKADVAASFQWAVVDVLAKKTERAVVEYKPKSLLVAGGVAANNPLRSELKKIARRNKLKFEVPPLNLCTDNAAMIGLAAYYKIKKNVKPKKVEVRSVWNLS